MHASYESHSLENFRVKLLVLESEFVSESEYGKTKQKILEPNLWR
jgi:hypothetical protein